MPDRDERPSRVDLSGIGTRHRRARGSRATLLFALLLALWIWGLAGGVVVATIVLIGGLVVKLRHRREDD